MLRVKETRPAKPRSFEITLGQALPKGPSMDAIVRKATEIGAVRIVNRTPLAQTMLCFANVAVNANDTYQIIFPPSTQWVTFHSKNQFSEWPISHQRYSGADFTAGVDVSWYKNHTNANSMFAWNYTDDFFAGYDHGRFAIGGFVLEVHADDAAVENPQTLDGIQIGGTPMAEVGTGTDPMVAAFHHAENVERIPDLVFGIAHGTAVFVEGNLDIKLLRRGFPGGDLFGRFRADGVEFHLFRNDVSLDLTGSTTNGPDT